MHPSFWLLVCFVVKLQVACERGQRTLDSDFYSRTFGIEEKMDLSTEKSQKNIAYVSVLASRQIGKQA